MYFNIFTDVEVDDRRLKKFIIESNSEFEEERISEPQEIKRPDRERDRPLPSRYDDERRDANRDRFFEQLQYADLYRFGY